MNTRKMKKYTFFWLKLATPSGGRGVYSFHHFGLLRLPACLPPATEEGVSGYEPLSHRVPASPRICRSWCEYQFPPYPYGRMYRGILPQVCEVLLWKENHFIVNWNMKVEEHQEKNQKTKETFYFPHAPCCCPVNQCFHRVPTSSVKVLMKMLHQSSWPLNPYSEFAIPLPGLPRGSGVKNLPVKAGDLGSIPGSGRAQGEGDGNPLQYSCLGNPPDRGAWCATVHGVAKSQT